MHLYYNSNDRFGDPGPFEANSRDELADEMMPTFREWAEETDHPEHEIAAMRELFIRGLEEITPA